MGSGRSSKLQLAATLPRKSHQVQLAPGPPSGGILTSPPSTAPTKQGWVPTILCCSSSTKPLGERAPSVVGSCRQLPPAQHKQGSLCPRHCQHEVLSTRCSARGSRWAGSRAEALPSYRPHHLQAWRRGSSAAAPVLGWPRSSHAAMPGRRQGQGVPGRRTGG